MRVAIVGRPNVGKSSLLNAVSGEERALVSPVAGTTRDVVDTVFDHHLGRVRLVDTAGIRRRGVVSSDVEHYSLLRAFRAEYPQPIMSKAMTVACFPCSCAACNRAGIMSFASSAREQSPAMYKNT